MSDWRVTALARPALLAEECMHPRFAHRLPDGSSVVLTVNAGYE